MQKKQQKMLARIIISSIIFFPLLVLEHMGKLVRFSNWMMLGIFLVPYLIIGYNILFKAVRNIKNGQIFDENFLMCIATIGAFGVKEFSEAVAVMLFYQVGELFQDIAVGKSRQAIADMMDIAPEYANLEIDGKVSEVEPDEVKPGSIIVIKPGEKVPLDGVVIEGNSRLDTSALTGESVPRSVKPGDEIISGCINGGNIIKVRTTKEYDDCTVSKILELVEDAADKKATVENFITRFARYYTPFVTIGAVLLAVLGPLVSGGGIKSINVWVLRACTFLVVSCPCALVISVPMGFFGGIGAASRKGILIKGSNFLELMSSVDTLVFDKTGTLTKGKFEVTKVVTVNGFDEKKLVETAALGESISTHPIAESVVDFYKRENDNLESDRISQAQEISGYGISAQIDGSAVLLGNAKLLEKENISYTEAPERGTIVYIAVDGSYAGYILISDSIKDGVAKAISDMKKLGIRNTVMLTGDSQAVAEGVASEIGIDGFYAGLLPGDKVQRVEELLEGLNGKRRLAFVGDGINDAPVLSRADIGIAMGSMGSDAAIEAADIVLMDDDVQKISDVVKISRKTIGIVRENIVFALGIKILVLGLAALGMANMWAAVFADVGVSVLAIMNSMRTLKN